MNDIYKDRHSCACCSHVELVRPVKVRLVLEGVHRTTIIYLCKECFEYIRDFGDGK